MNIEIRPVRDDEFEPFLKSLESTFGSQSSEEEIADARTEVTLDRTLAAIDGTRYVGTAGTVTFDMTVPGGRAVPAGGLTWVSVSPTHRRRGILTAMMRQQLRDVRERGEAVSILLSSESGIYGRYGYGQATEELQFEIPKIYRGFGRHPEITGNVDLLGNDTAMEVIPQFYDRARLLYPGSVNRDAAWWEVRRKDRETHRGGMSDRRYAVYTSGSGSIDGYAAYRMKVDWESPVMGGQVRITDFVTATPEARAALFQFCTSIDLIETVYVVNAPVDDPLRWMLADPRRLKIARHGDFLWVRPVDIPKLLAARRYSTEDRVVLEVSDPFMEENSGRYAVESGPDDTGCKRVRTRPDLSMQVDDLGAISLGGVSFRSLAAAGRIVENRAGALRRADLMFSSYPAPWASTGF